MKFIYLCISVRNKGFLVCPLRCEDYRFVNLLRTFFQAKVMFSFYFLEEVKTKHYFGRKTSLASH